MLKIILGYWLDSKAYPDPLQEREASVGTVVTGFSGLIHILETQLGLITPQVSENVRIAVWQELIGNLDDGSFPFSRSFAVDSWNTTKELLRRRDELVISGWDPNVHVGGGKWIGALAQLELNYKKNAPGFSDRVRFVMDKLKKNENKLFIDEIYIVDEEVELWDPWSIQLIELLKESGIKINKKDYSSLEIKEPSTDLERLKGVLLGNLPNQKARGDNSLIFIQSDQEMGAADFLTSWLQQNESGRTVIIKGEGSILLDEVLHRRGVARLGVDASSKWRAVLQVLSLTIDTYWSPVSVERMLELFTIPTSPVPRLIRYKLARALSESPGIGSEKWDKAIEEGIQEYEQKWREEELDEREIRKKRKTLMDKLDLWVNHEFYDREEGLPFEKLGEICQAVSNWANSHLQVTHDPIYAQAALIADEVFRGIKTLGVSRVSHLQVARIIDSVIGVGAKLTSYYEEAANRNVVSLPGQLWNECDTIIWWGFNGDLSKQNLKTWTTNERSWLEKQGIHLVKESVERQREALTWRRAIRFANKKLILISLNKIKGEEVPIHPLWDEIRYAVANDFDTVNKITFDAANLWKGKETSIFEKKVERTEAKMKSLPEPKIKWSVPTNVVKPREEESATSIESLIGCPLQWTFHYVANIKKGNILSLPNESIMLGNLGHAILENLMKEKTDWHEEEVNRRTGELFEELTPQLAAPLLEEKNKVERNKTKRSLQRSITQFFKVLNHANVQLKETEVELIKQFNDNTRIKSRLDIVGKTKTGEKLLIDSKWSNNSRRYKGKLENVSIQLAIYHWLLVDNDDEQLPVAYFMLRTGEFLSLPDDTFPTQYHVEGPTLQEAFQVTKDAAENTWKMLSEGTAIASGVLKKQGDYEADEEIELFTEIIEPPCYFCDYKNLCGERRVK